MFALGIRYLNGWAMATHPSDRERAEWPPHPDRVFMALAAAYFETETEREEQRSLRAALEWLESLGPPELAASKAEERPVTPIYVPVNDTEIARAKSDSPEKLAKRLARLNGVGDLKSAKAAGLAILPEFRSRQSLSSPVVIPDDPRVYLVWSKASCLEEHASAVRSLCERVTFVGEPSSLVQMWIESTPPASTLVPDDQGIHTSMSLRVFSRSGESGRLKRLEDHHALEMRLGRRLRIPCDAIRYRPVESPEGAVGDLARSLFDSNVLILRRIEGSRLGMESTLQLTEALHKAVMSLCDKQPPPSWISGHAPGGVPSQEPHLAFLALADVGHDHADGHLLGVAIAVPTIVDAAQQKHLGPVLFYTREDEMADAEHVPGSPRALDLRMGRVGAWCVELVDDDPRVALQSAMWTGWPDGARLWATVTPIAFDSHPKEERCQSDPPRLRAEKEAAYWKNVEDMIADACVNIGLPRPVNVTATASPIFRGAAAAGRMPRIVRKDGSERRQTHAILRFDLPVIGPLLLGAGRYRGYGLCRPMRKGEQA